MVNGRPASLAERAGKVDVIPRVGEHSYRIVGMLPEGALMQQWLDTKRVSLLLTLVGGACA
jgi:hypothetical protein